MKKATKLSFRGFKSIKNGVPRPYGQALPFSLYWNKKAPETLSGFGAFL
jgi:hypothetical protein